MSPSVVARGFQAGAVTQAVGRPGGWLGRPHLLRVRVSNGETVSDVHNPCMCLWMPIENGHLFVDNCNYEHIVARSSFPLRCDHSHGTSCQDACSTVFQNRGRLRRRTPAWTNISCFIMRRGHQGLSTCVISSSNLRMSSIIKYTHCNVPEAGPACARLFIQAHHGWHTRGHIYAAV
jgi:hypothetical protein